MIWEQLAAKHASTYGAWLPIVLATVQAETGGRNVPGDGGSALGFGQVWPKWHMWAFEKAAADNGVSLAGQDLSAVVHGNDELSMAVAVLVIKSFWESSTGSTLEERWENFTRRYVGPGIPASDLERRRTIWHEYSAPAAEIPKVNAHILPKVNVSQTAPNTVTVTSESPISKAALPLLLLAGAAALILNAASD